MIYEKGLVSVVMPTYKRPSMLDRAIESILNQSYKNLELLLVNDNIPGDEFSADLEKRIEKYRSDPRFRFVTQEKHINGAAARNAGIAKAKGEYIAFLDDDDRWEANKLEKQVELLSSLDETWGGVSCRYRYENSDGKTVGHSAPYTPGNVYKDILMLSTDIPTSSLLLRHECLDVTGAFDENLKRHQDFQLTVDFTYRYKIRACEEELMVMDISDAQNRPGGDTLKEHKKRFFESVKPILDTLSEKDRNAVFAMHNFELGYIYLKNGDVKNGIRYCIRLLSSPKAFKAGMKKVLRKLS